MRRILIDKRIEAIAEDFVDRINALDNSRAESPTAGLEKLEEKIMRSSSLIHKAKLLKYMKRIIDEYDLIVSASPSQMIDLMAEFDNILPASDLRRIRFGGKGRKTFHEVLVSKLRYDKVQSEIFPAIMADLGIKACVYCNASLAIEYERIPDRLKPKESKIVCRYELDHFYPKSDYPFLATSFYNLQPVCGTCNRNKSTRGSKFNLYTTRRSELDVFQFELVSGSLPKFRVSFDEKDIKLQLKPQKADLTKNHQELFGIDGLYETQKDVVAEIVVRAMAYPRRYRNQLIEKYSKLRLNREFVDRVVAGNYLNPEDTHRRPLAKLYSDIWNQVYGKREV